MDPDDAPSPDVLRALLPPTVLAQCRPLDLARGETLFRAGQRPRAMYFVREGEIAMQRHGPDGGVVVLQRTRQGFVGEASLHAERYHCDAVATLDAVLAGIPLAAVRTALAADPGFAMRWIEMLGREVRRLRLHCERLGLRTVEARLLHLLDTEGGRAGVPIASGLKSLARELGVTHEALYRAIGDLARRGIVVRSAGRLARAGTRASEAGSDSRSCS